ncbi:SdiA-regulated domain-containing protein [Dyadobacter sp. LJ53]|uniref:SdiA-regulated domain-containing protein n=1 Tax=Dyadobacter chenwenxiniae TaxID=2906456 RepID=UPI001F48BE42|nr:SdiA-regulated domain-containing protein [Dyadobacter chenwenxiniae]MCF0051651.1 SdiA-regulated domain-containing protein [Dyadobacter chenwenxiniae]
MKNLSFHCLIFLVYFLPLKNLSAQVEVIKSEELNRVKGASGVYFYKDRLYIIPERCLEIIEIDVKGHSKRSIPLKGMPSTMTTLEGITIANGYFLLIDEEKPRIYKVDMQGNYEEEYRFNADPEHKDNDGFEGIAFNADKKLLYVLHERAKVESSYQAIIYTLSFEEDLSVLQTVDTLFLPLGNGDFRYTDICFKNNKFMAIKSKKGEYFINDFDFENGVISKSGYSKREISKSISDFLMMNKDYSSNLEGITLDEKNNIYLISDNMDGGTCDRAVKKQTMLLRLK